MFKGRIGVWITVIALCVLGTYFIDNIPKWADTTDITISSQIDDSQVAENIANNRYGDYTVRIATESPDIIISNSTDKPAGYTVKEKMLFSPLVLYVRNTIDTYNNGFIESNAGHHFQIDLKTVLGAMEQNKDWNDIGIHNNVVKGKVVLYIPNEKEWYYSEVEELFYTALNGDKEPTEEERKILKPRVDALISKCTKVASMEQEIQEESSNPSEDYKVFIAPECFFMTFKGMGTAYSHDFTPVYFTKSVFVYADLYIKDNAKTRNNIKITDDFISAIQEDRGFMQSTGWRVKNSTFDTSWISRRLMKVPV